MPNRQIKKFLLTAFLIFAAAEISAHPRFEKMKTTSTMNQEEKLNLPPLDVFDFIQNIKYGIETEIFLEGSFFTKENLTNFTNGEDVKNFGDDNQYFVVDDTTIEGISLGIGFSREGKSEIKSGGLVTHFVDRSLNVDYIIKTFGPPEKTNDPYTNILLFHLPVLEPKTHDYGHSEIHHILIGKNSTTEIISFTSKDGSIYKIDVKQTRE